MDIFIEQIVKRQLTTKDHIRNVATCVGLFLLFIVVSYIALLVYPALFFSVALVALCAAVYGMYYFVSASKVEYEYSVTNGFVVVDKIIAKRKRKRVISFESKEVELFAKYQEKNYSNKEFDYYAEAITNTSNEIWVVEVMNKVKGKSVLTFEPNEKVLKAIKPYLRRQVAFDGFGRN